jgi:signal transduction histidine kinase
LAPVEAMRRRAESVSLARGGERLPLPEAHDEIRRLGQTLNEMLARLEASFERERRFVADASHELRTPLAVVKAELEGALRLPADDPQHREALVAALDETDHLVQLSQDLLLVAQAGDGNLPVRPEALDVRELLDRARERFHDRAYEQGRAIVVDVPGDLRAELDPLRLRQAIGNVVDNALRYGEGTVTLRAAAADGRLVIEVSDEGAGFSPDLAARAFERFTRGDQARSRDGTGLGLAIVRAVVEAHGGTASVEGATVRLTFPPSSHLHLSALRDAPVESRDGG